MLSDPSSVDTHPKREAILAAARTLFVAKGYEDTTISDIAREAGVAVGTVYLYFRNKRELYTGVALDVEAMIARAFLQPELLELPFAEVPKAIIDAIFTISHQHDALLALLQIDTQTSHEVQLHKHSHQQVAQSLERIFQRAIERGELAPFNTEMYASMLTLMGSEMMHQCFAIEQGEREELYRASLLEFLERLFFGPSLRAGYPVES